MRPFAAGSPAPQFPQTVRTAAFALAAALAAALSFPPAPAAAMQDAAPPPASPDVYGGLRVYLMTMGQGDLIYEKFGHNALWLRNPLYGIDVAYNWGIFDFREPGYYGRLIRGNMMYRMEPFHGTAMADVYMKENRSIWVQELNLTRAQKQALVEFLEWNDTDENRFYRYDYYRDNCSTRVRDAIDRVLGGSLRASLEPRTTGTTYRMHTERLTADLPAEHTGLMLVLGPDTDRPIDAWEESFLPVKLMEHVRNVSITGEDGSTQPLVLDEAQMFQADRPPEHTKAPDRLLLFGTVGVLLGAVLLALGALARRSPAGAVAFGTLAFLWALVIGLAGTLIAGLWAFTDHLVTYHNENVLQANPLSLVLAVMVAGIAFGRRRRSTYYAAAAVAALSVLGFVLQVLPGLDQVNGTLIALTLPAHTALALAVRGIVRVTPVRATTP